MYPFWLAVGAEHFSQLWPQVSQNQADGDFIFLHVPHSQPGLDDEVIAALILCRKLTSLEWWDFSVIKIRLSDFALNRLCPFRWRCQARRAAALLLRRDLRCVADAVVLDREDLEGKDNEIEPHQGHTPKR